MKITSVEYRKLQSTGNYCNHTIGATAAVGPDEDPQESLVELRKWVDAQLDIDTAKSEIAEEIQALRVEAGSEVAHFQRMVEEAKATWERAKAFLEKHGVDTGSYEVPF